MSLLPTFRLSLYLSLALASACLCYAEWLFLPEIPLITLLVGGLLIMAYRMEGRYELSLQAANFVGVMLTAFLSLWVLYQFFRPPSDSLVRQLPFPTNLLPYLGPVLLFLIPAKLVRHKDIGDFWAMQGLGVIAVALACTMAGDFFFGFLLVCWLVAFAWNMTLFYLYRLEHRVLEHPETSTESKLPNRLNVTRRSVRWSIGIVGLGLLVFMFTPRINNNRWELTRRMEVGHSADSQIDLNRTGELNINTELAFEVKAENLDGSPKLDLNPNQLWRNQHLNRYEDGRWVRDGGTGSIHLRERVQTSPLDIRGAGGLFVQTKRSVQEVLPNLGPNRYFLTFYLKKSVGLIPILASPISWVPNQPSPVAMPTRLGMYNWQQMPDGNLTLVNVKWLGDGPYTQVLVPSTEDDVGQPIKLTAQITDPQYQAYSLIAGCALLGMHPITITKDHMLRTPRMPLLMQYTNSVIDDLIQQGKLPEDLRITPDPFTKRIHSKYHAILARALCNHLSTAEGFVHTLDLQRKDKRIDPIEDFLINLKQGDCKRFATALVLMLRSQGIPCQFVLGFKGCESQEDGRYYVRQSHAHAWVEALVRDEEAHKPEHTADRLVVYRWLTLDPTPASSAIEEYTSSWFGSAQSQGQAFFKDFILGYNSELRNKIFDAIRRTIDETTEDIQKGNPKTIALILGPIFLGVGIWFLIHRFRRKPLPLTNMEEEINLVVMPFQSRLYAILAKHGFELKRGQTPLEFAQQVQSKLQGSPNTNLVAKIPVDAVQQLYRVRYGLQQLAEEETRQLENRLTALESALDVKPTTAERNSG